MQDYIISRIQRKFCNFIREIGLIPDTILVGQVEYNLLHTIECTRVVNKNDTKRLISMFVMGMKVKQIEDLTYLRIVKGTDEI